jgi:hypothetical protein
MWAHLNLASEAAGHCCHQHLRGHPKEGEAKRGLHLQQCTRTRLSALEVLVLCCKQGSGHKWQNLNHSSYCTASSQRMRHQELLLTSMCAATSGPAACTTLAAACAAATDAAATVYDTACERSGGWWGLAEGPSCPDATACAARMELAGGPDRAPPMSEPPIMVLSCCHTAVVSTERLPDLLSPFVPNGGM